MNFTKRFIGISLVYIGIIAVIIGVVYASAHTPRVNQTPNVGSGGGTVISGGVTSIIAGTGISVSGATGDVTVTNTATAGSGDAFTHPVAGQSATTSLMIFNGNATSTGFSANYASIGSSATTTITASGFVGLGTTTPWGQLSVNPNGIGTIPEFVIGSSSTTHFLVDSAGNTSVGSTSPWGLSSVSSNNNNSRPEFVVGSSSATHFITDGSGNVGVGTTSPAALFSVAGSSYFSNTITEDSATNAQINLGRNATTNTALNVFRTARIDKWSFGLRSDAAVSPTSDIFHLRDAANSVDALALVPGAAPLVGVGTSTPQYTLDAFNSTAPQLALSVGGGSSQWVMRAMPGGSFALATSTASGAIATSTNSVFVVDNNAKIYLPTSSIQSGAATDYWCYDANAQLVRVSALCTTSARRYKKDITSLSLGLADLLKLQPVSYYRKDPLDAMDSHMQMGFIADDVAATSPDLNEMLVTYVGGGTSGTVQGFRYDQFTALLAQSIKDLNEKVDGITVGKFARSAEENWQWFVMGLMFLWIVRLELRKK